MGWLAVLGGGAAAGVAFTVSLLIADLAFAGVELQEAKLGILTAALASSISAGSVLRIGGRLPVDVKARALLGRAESIVDLAEPVDPVRDHVRGPERCERHTRRVRRLRMPVLRHGRAGS